MTTTSTFAERYEFSRDRQRVRGRWEPDHVLATHIERQPSAISEIKAREEAPAASLTLALAKRMEVDPGWLAFGAESAAPAPGEFQEWLSARRERIEAERLAAEAAKPKRGKRQDEPPGPRRRTVKEERKRGG